MRIIIYFLILLTLLTSCSENETDSEKLIEQEEIEEVAEDSQKELTLDVKESEIEDKIVNENKNENMALEEYKDFKTPDDVFNTIDESLKLLE